MAAGVLAWCRQELKKMNIDIPSDMIRQLENLSLVDHIKALLNTSITFAKRTPSVMIIGRGLVGRGAYSFIEQIGLPVTQWSRENTRVKGPYKELIEYDILLNAIRLDKTLTSPFLTDELIRQPDRLLQVIVDVSCDTTNPNNPLPIYHQRTTFDKPTLRIIDGKNPLDIIAIPTLALLLPVESSTDFSKQLLKQLLNLHDKNDEVWNRTRRYFTNKCKKISPVPLPRDNTMQLEVTLLQEYLYKWNETFNLNLIRSIVFEDVLDIAALSEDLNLIIQQNEILRTNFSMDSSGRVVQIIKDDIKPVIHIEHFENIVNDQERDSKVQEFLLSELNRPFDVSNDILFRIYVLSIGVNKYNITLIGHPLILDSYSILLMLYQLVGQIKIKKRKNQLEYSDFAHWERERWIIESRPEGEEVSPIEERETWHERQIGYWKNQLGGSLQVLQLPIDHSRPATQNYESTQKVYSLPRDLSERIFNKTKSLDGSSPTFVLLLTAFKILLYRLCGENDIIIGTTSHGRKIASVKNMAGPFANLLALRTYIHQNMTLQETWDKVKETYEDALSNSEVPFERLYEELFQDEKVRSTISPNTIFLIKFDLLNEISPELTSSSSIHPYYLKDTLSIYDFDVGVSLNNNEIELRVVYNKSLFDVERIDEIVSQYQLLLDQIVSNDQLNIISYTLVTERARSLLPDPSKPLESTWRGSIHSYFYRNSLNYPDKHAIIYQDLKITYSQLSSAVNKLSQWLLKNGISSNDVVAIYGHRSPPVVVAIMGILTAGAAYTMMDPAYPSLRVKQCLDIAKPKAFIRISETTDPSDDLLEYLKDNNIILFNLPTFDEIEEVLSDMPNKYPDHIETTDDSVAVITFTSGSTGLPKGVIGRHGPLTFYYPWMAERFGIGENDRFSMCSGIAHDPLQRDIFTPLFFGATIYIPTQEDIVQPGQLSKWMNDHQITVTCMTPALGQILTTIDNPSFTIESLRNSFFVGDALIKRDVNRLRKLCPNVRCINMYGSTETQRSVGYFEVPKDDSIFERMPEVMPAGVGMKGCDMILLNSANQLCGIGEVSEIYVRSHHLSLGYIGLDDQTKEKFIQNTFSNIKGDRMYKTGDLGRYTPSGILQCFGRADDQVKIRGFRIEIGEINATLSLHPSVKENVTIVREDIGSDKKLVSYVVPKSINEKGDMIDVSTLSKDLRAFLKDKLPIYMVPSYIVIIQSMPLTPNGKINKAALPKVDMSQNNAQDENKSIRALTQIEDKLMHIWSRVLSIDIQSPDDNFFEIGGHSILATRLTFEISNEFSIELPMQFLFLSPTITLMGKSIERILSGGKALSTQSESLNLDEEVASCEIPKPSESLLLSYKHIDHPQNVLLTGGTGFLGAFLLHDLLSSSDSISVHCLVRSSDKEKGRERIIKNLMNHLIWKDEFEQRIHAVVGDLSKPHLGISDNDYNELIHKIDIVVHNGAHVHWLQPYDKLKPTNVGGTIEALRFCSEGRIKPLHYVSTTSVFDDNYHRKNVLVKESDLLDTWEGIDGGYPQSKWVAEKVVELARSNGIPCNIYRPGYVTGHSKSGVWNTDDFLCRLIKGCIQLKSVPILEDASLDMANVDYVTNSIVYLILNSKELNRSYNVTNPNEFSFEGLFNSISSLGYELERISYKEWKKKLIDTCKKGDNALSPMITFFSDGWANGLKMHPLFDLENIRKQLEPSGIRCCKVEDLIPIYFSYLIRCGYVESPRKANNLLGIDWNIIGSGVEKLTRTNRH